jgi:uncharacterized membrane protein
MKKDLAQLMLNTAANLLGFCLIVITSIHLADFSEGRFVDELTVLVAVLLTVSSVLSFIVLRHEESRATKQLYFWAGAFFMASLIGILVSIVLIALNYI